MGVRANGKDQIVIEPQVPDYWPRTPQLREADAVVLSRFAYMRRRANDMVLELPRAGALFKICNPKIAAALAMLSTPQQIRRLRRHPGFPGIELLALLVDCQILFKTGAAGGDGLRPAEGDDSLVLWDFHDLLFHARSTEGRHANPLGGVYPYVGVISPLPAVRPSWPGNKIDLRKFSDAHPEAISSAAKLLRERHSTREFDDQRPITLAELARFLDSTARVQSNWQTTLDSAGDGPTLTYTARPYPSGGRAATSSSSIWPSTNAKGCRADSITTMPADMRWCRSTSARSEFEAHVEGSRICHGRTATAPQILITIAARFGRTSWKYSSIAYALILKDVGVLMQTFYLMATDMGLGGCAIGTTNIDLFAKMTGIEFHVEGPVGQFALGRGAEPGHSV